MSIKYKCNECGHVFPDELNEYLENGNQVYCERCGAPFSIKIVKLKQKTKIREEDLNSKESEKEAKALVIGFILTNFILVVYFLSFTPHYQVNDIGLITFFIILGIGILEIIRAIKLFKNKGYRNKILIINTIGQVLLRKILYPSPMEKSPNSIGNEKKALKILIATMYVNFILVIFYYAIAHIFIFIYQIWLFFLIHLIIEILYFNIGLIILLKVRLLRYRFLKVNSIVQAILYNCSIVLLFIFKPNLNLILLLLLDACILFLNIKIIKNEWVLRQYLPSKYHKCHNCGSKMKNHGNYCPKCVALLVERGKGLEEIPIQKPVHKLPSDKIPPEPEESVVKNSELDESFEKKPKERENMVEFDLELLEDLSILKEKRDKKLLKKYLLKRFVVVSEQTRNELDKLSLSREEKIEILKDLAFLTSKEQKNILELLVHLCNN